MKREISVKEVVAVQVQCIDRLKANYIHKVGRDGIYSTIQYYGIVQRINTDFL